jgi:hypothetical protein
MDLIHNGAEERIDPERFATVGDALAACIDPGGFVVLSVRLDGCEIADEERVEIELLPTTGGGRLEIESRPLRDVARDGLESAATYARAVATAFGRTAELLRDGEVARGTAVFRDAVDATDVLLAAIRSAAAALGAVADPLTTLEASLERGIGAMERHFAATDWVALADCLEFEVATEVATWQDRIGTVLRSVEEFR